VKSQVAQLKVSTDQTSSTWRRLYVPQVGHAVWVNFGCWHCGQAARDAAVVFHMARRERVLERDIFRFGTGTVIVLNLNLPRAERAQGLLGEVSLIHPNS
jgi:hypothetical protein